MSVRGDIRVGMVGSGYMAKTHTLGYENAALIYGSRLPAVERVRISDLTPELAAAGAERWGWAEATADWREITAAADIDLVDVVTPNNAHAEPAIDAIRNGKHVLCEKPLAATVDDALAMYEEAARAGVVHMVGFYYRLWPAVAMAKAVVERGEVGEVRHFRGRFFQDYAADPALPFSWRFDSELAGAGAVGDIGSHIVDIARYLAGDIDRVLATGRTLIPERPDGAGGAAAVSVDDLFSLMVEFANGATGSIEASWAATGHKCDLGFELIGSAGSIRFTWERANQLEVYSDSDPVDERGFRTVLIGGVHPRAGDFWFAPAQGLGYGDAFTMGIGELLDAIQEGRDASPSFLDGLRAAEVVAAALESAAQQAWVDVDRHVPAGAVGDG
jgi:predicted dehydrogenase